VVYKYLSSAAHTFYMARRFDEAARVLQKAVDIRRFRFGEKPDLEVAERLSDLAGCLMYSGEGRFRALEVATQ
jgi:hypothetical protein